MKKKIGKVETQIAIMIEEGTLLETEMILRVHLIDRRGLQKTTRIVTQNQTLNGESLQKEEKIRTLKEKTGHRIMIDPTIKIGKRIREGNLKTKLLSLRNQN